jgi:hypothetical protein
MLFINPFPYTNVSGQIRQEYSELVGFVQDTEVDIAVYEVVHRRP